MSEEILKKLNDEIATLIKEIEEAKELQKQNRKKIKKKLYETNSLIDNFEPEHYVLFMAAYIIGYTREWEGLLIVLFIVGVIYFKQKRRDENRSRIPDKAGKGVYRK